MSDNLRVLERTNPEMFCQYLEAVVVTFEIRYGFFIDWLQVKGLDRCVYIVKLVLFQTAYRACLLYLFFVKTYDQLIDDSPCGVRVKMTSSWLVSLYVPIKTVAAVEVFANISADAVLNHKSPAWVLADKISNIERVLIEND